MVKKNLVNVGSLIIIGIFWLWPEGTFPGNAHGIYPWFDVG